MTGEAKEKMDLLVTGLGCCRTDIRIWGGGVYLPYLAHDKASPSWDCPGWRDF